VLLNTRYQLHDIDEQLCAGAARRWAKRTGARLSADELDARLVPGRSGLEDE
jgi:hypothetical protein